MVFVRSPENKTLALDVNPTTTTLSSLIHQIELRLNLPAALQRLYLLPRLLSTPQNNDVHLSLLGVCSNSTLTLHVPLLGGKQDPVPPKNRLDFLHTKPPPNYVAGLGRGATGFTTRSDIGPARAAPDLPDRSIGAASNPKITELLKRKLSTMSFKDWEAIPDIGDYSRNKKPKFESFVPVPDTLLEKDRQEKEHMAAVDPKSRAVGGTETPASHTDLNVMGEGRGNVLSLKQDRLSDSVSGQTVVDPKGYLTDLGSMKITCDAEISDIKKLRMLLSWVIHSRPKDPRGWIAAARLEVIAGKLQSARQLIEKGCEECPTSEDVWLEASGLVNPNEAKAFILRGIKKNPKSVTLLLEAAKLEHADATKRRVLMKGLESISDSVRLWKAVVELSNEEDARLLLQRAVEFCPLHVELWIAYARLETYENAKKVLNRAREKLPKEQAIWITAAKLEEANGNTSWVEKIIERGIRTLQREGVEIDREAWMKEAEAAERAGSVLTCQVIRNTIGVGVEEEDGKRTWVADAEEDGKRTSGL